VEVLLAPVSVFQSTWALVFVFEFVQEARARSGRRWFIVSFKINIDFERRVSERVNDSTEPPSNLTE
jgi:hypothetical protein